MKNLIKKIFACVCFIVIGCATFAGCTLTADQQIAIDKLTTSVDNFVSKLTKEEAAEKIKLARLKFYMSTVENFHLKVDFTQYDGFFFNSGKELKTMMNVYYKDSGSAKFIYGYNPSTDSNYFTKTDFTNNKTYEYDFKTENFEFKNYDLNQYWNMTTGDAFTQFLGSNYEIKPEDISHLEVDGDTIKCKLLIENFMEQQKYYVLQEVDVEFVGNNLSKVETKQLSYDFRDAVIKVDADGNVIFDGFGVPIKESGEVEISSLKMVANYDFNCDFSEIEAKIAEIEAENIIEE